VARYDLVIVGMGSGGVVAAEFAARMGVRVAAVEADRVGGDCLWTGCVPSKALLASARVAHQMRTADRFGIRAVDPEVDTAAVWRRIRAVQDEIAATDDDPARFERMGVEVLHGRARLTGPHTVEVDGRTLETRFVLLCTGSHPRVPAIPGLAEARFLTSESLFTVERPPASLLVLGGGPIGVEMAQGCNRLGIAATLAQKGPRLLPRDEPELVDTLAGVLSEEGVDVHLGVEIERVAVEAGMKVAYGREGGRPVRLAAEELLVAVGREPAIDGLGLDDAGVERGPRGVVVDASMRTSVPSIYATGDLAGRYLFTHSAGHESALAVRAMLFPGKGKVSELVPWCTFTEPELAHAGPTSAEARELYTEDVEVRRVSLERSDRARCDAATVGGIVLVSVKGRLVGAHSLAPAAGELIHELALSIRNGAKLHELAGLVHVYPTLSTSVVLLCAEAAYERAGRFSWLIRKA
jgi:pyruvate/2-oxoglutarate dehydrogenase complex dihydrolipoamide dehydrogenase (E3) component